MLIVYFVDLIFRTTNSDGRASGFISQQDFEPITYKLKFHTNEYFKGQGKETFYPYAEVVFHVKDTAAHYHIPLLLSAYGYTTYRGS